MIKLNKKRIFKVLGTAIRGFLNADCRLNGFTQLYLTGSGTLIL